MDRYENLTKLGASKVGPVYRADDTMTGQPVILKIISSGDAPHPLDTEAVARVAGPLSALGGFNIARFVELTHVAEGTAVVSEFVAGPSILQSPDKGKIKGTAALDVANQLINALCDGERLRMLHGDLKPSNVLLAKQSDGRPHVKVTDWGLSAARSGPTPESLLFTAPERLGGAPPSARADLFSAGAVLFFLYTGMSLVNGKSAAEVTESWKKAAPNHLKKIRKDLPGKLIKVVLSLLEMKPDKRPSSALAVSKELAELKPPSLPQPAAPAASSRGTATSALRPGGPAAPQRPSQPGIPPRPGGPPTVVRPGMPAQAAPAPVPTVHVAALAPQPIQPPPSVVAVDPSQLVIEAAPEPIAPEPLGVADAPVTVVPMRPPPEIAAKLNLPPQPVTVAQPPPQTIYSAPPPYGQPAPAYAVNPQGYPPQGYSQPGYNQLAYPPAAYGQAGPSPYGAATHPIITGSPHAIPAGVRTQPFQAGQMPYGYGYPGGPQMVGRMARPRRSKLPLILVLVISMLTLGGGGFWLFKNWNRLTGGGQAAEDAPVTSTSDLAAKLRNQSGSKPAAPKAEEQTPPKKDDKKK